MHDWLIIGYNTGLVAFAATVFGAVSAAIGVFALLRARALLSDALGHAAWPGVGASFLVLYAFGMTGTALAPLFLALGALCSAVAGVVFMHWLKNRGAMHEDGAIACVLGYFYGFGVVLFSYIQTLEGTSRSALGSLLLGAAALISFAEAVAITLVSLVGLGFLLLCSRQWAVLCFDPVYANHWRSGHWFDALLSAVIIMIAVTGLQTVGLILVVAIIIIPASAAQFWVVRLKDMLWLAPCFGAVASVSGVMWSARVPDIPTGGAIVLSLAAIFFVSAVFSPRMARKGIRGIVRKVAPKMARLWFWTKAGEGAIESKTRLCPPMDPRSPVDGVTGKGTGQQAGQQNGREAKNG